MWDSSFSLSGSGIRSVTGEAPNPIFLSVSVYSPLSHQIRYPFPSQERRDIVLVYKLYFNQPSMKSGRGMGWPSMRRHSTRITDSLLEDILSRVPVKSIVRFWCVSKHWLKLTHDPYFMGMHLRNQSQLRIALIEEEKDVGNITNCCSDPFSDVCHSKRLQIYSLTDDGICTLTNTFPCKCKQRLFTKTINGVLGAKQLLYHTDCILFNPTTKQSVPFPTTPPTSNLLDLCTWAFGFHPLTREYKLLRITHIANSPRYVSRIEVCSPGESWRSLGRTRHDFPPLSTCINGVIYWSTLNQYFLAFHLGDEKLSVIKPPNYCQLDSNSYVNGFHEFDGKLCFQCHHHKDSTLDRIDVWTCINRSRNTWIKMHTICFQSFGTLLPSTKFVLLLWVYKEKVLVRIGLKRIFCYYFLTNTWKLVATFQNAVSYSPFAAYVETLHTLVSLSRISS